MHMNMSQVTSRILSLLNLYKKTYYHACPIYTTNLNLSYQNLVLNGTLSYSYDNFQQISCRAQTRHVCRAHTCLSALCNYNVHVHQAGCTLYMLALPYLAYITVDLNLADWAVSVLFFTVCLRTLPYLLSLALICIYMYKIHHVHLLEVTKQQTCMKHSYCTMYEALQCTPELEYL